MSVSATTSTSFTLCYLPSQRCKHILKTKNRNKITSEPKYEVHGEVNPFVRKELWTTINTRVSCERTKLGFCVYFCQFRVILSELMVFWETFNSPQLIPCLRCWTFAWLDVDILWEILSWGQWRNSCRSKYSKCWEIFKYIKLIRDLV